MQNRTWYRKNWLCPTIELYNHRSLRDDASICPPFNSIPISLSLLSFFLHFASLSNSKPPSFHSCYHPPIVLSVQISPKISPNNGMYVHHMQLYQCLSLNETSDLGMGYDCNKATDTIGSCRLGRPIITAWAVGGNVRA